MIKRGPNGGGPMTKWINAMTEIGMTRIRMDAICAYQSIKSEAGKSDSLLIYTSDNTLFEIIDNAEEIAGILDSNFEFQN
tara:strand:+ start:374 stop:613 length:240 start_codon:yes stop_codon:yes gene_type:complete